MSNLKIGMKVLLSFGIVILMLFVVTITVLVTSLRTIGNIETVDANSELQSLIMGLQSQFMRTQNHADVYGVLYDDETYASFEADAQKTLLMYNDIYACIGANPSLEQYGPAITALELEMTDWYKSVASLREVDLLCREARDAAVEAETRLIKYTGTMAAYQATQMAIESYMDLSVPERLNRTERLRKTNTVVANINAFCLKARLQMSSYDSTEAEEALADMRSVLLFLRNFLEDDLGHAESGMVLGALENVDIYYDSFENFIKYTEEMDTVLDHANETGEQAVGSMDAFIEQADTAMSLHIKNTVSLANTALIIVLGVSLAALMVIIFALAYRYTLDAMSESISVFETIFNNMEEVVVVIDPDSKRILFANDKAAMYGNRAENTTYWDIFHDGSEHSGARAVFDTLSRHGMKSGDTAQYEFEKQMPGDMISKWFLSRMMVIPWKDGRMTYLETVVDITARKQAERHLKNLAAFDSLTGLHSRNYGLEQLEKFLRSAYVRKEHMTICYFDLDGLKYVNDTFGHAEGDRYLKTVADILRGCVRATDLIIRMGGDEYLTAFPKCLKNESQHVINRFNEGLAAVNGSGQYEYTMRASIGFVEITPDNQMNLEEIIELADKAMYVDKLAHKGNRQALQELRS